jgi:RNA polymerase sigma factor, sigma-70 family
MNSKTSLDFHDLTFDNQLLTKVESGPKAHELRALTLALSQGDRTAWEELYLHLGDPVVDFLNRILRSYDDAFDIGQEVFIALWQNHGRIDPEKNIKGYLYTMAKTFAFDHIRKKKKQGITGSLSDMEPAEFDFAPDDIMEADEVRILIGIALESMPAQRKRIFEMYRFDGLSFEEIAAKTNLNKRTVENHIYNATKELKELLACAAFFLLLQ